MLLLLDTNEYLFTFGLLKKESCKKLLDILIDKHSLHPIRIPQLIIDEVRRNLTLESFKEFILFINTLTVVDDDTSVPFETGVKYELIGFKPADAFISAYTEWVGADALVTENRHFLSRRKDLPFRVVTAEEILPEL